MQGALEVMGIPYTGSGVMASALAHGQVAHEARVDRRRHPDAALRRREPDTDWARVLGRAGPAGLREAGARGLDARDHEGPHGRRTSRRPYAFAAKLRPARDRRGIRRRAGAHRDASSASEALPLVRIEAPGGNYDYQNKYFTDDTKYHCPAGVRPDVEEEIRRVALAALPRAGLPRLGPGGRDAASPTAAYSFLEMNTSPGMTGHSLVPIAARAVGLSLSGPLPAHPRGRGAGDAAMKPAVALALRAAGAVAARRPAGRGRLVRLRRARAPPDRGRPLHGRDGPRAGRRPRAPGRGAAGAARPATWRCRTCATP